MKSLVYLDVDRVDAAVCRSAAGVPVADLHEAMGPARGRPALMSRRMRPLNRGLHVAGPAVTAYCAPGDNLMMHRALYLAKAGDILVVACQSEDSGAQWGDVAAQYAKHKGLAGVIVHGCIRDTDTLERLRFPVWSTAISPAHPEKSGPGLVNAPIVCDGVLVRPGDLVVADGDGVLVIARQEAEATIARARQRTAREDDLARSIREGAHVWDLIGAEAAYRALDPEEIDGAWAQD